MYLKDQICRVRGSHSHEVGARVADLCSLRCNTNISTFFLVRSFRMFDLSDFVDDDIQ